MLSKIIGNSDFKNNFQIVVSASGGFIKPWSNCGFGSTRLVKA